MSVEQNKATVLSACLYLSDRNLPALFDLIHEKGSWSVPYRPDRFLYGGYRDKRGICELLTGFLGGFETFSFLVNNITAEGDRVVVEARSSGTGPGTAKYENKYIIFFQLEDGKLHTVREYFDPFQVLAYVEQMPSR